MGSILSGILNAGLRADTRLELRPRLRLANLMGPVFGLLLLPFPPLLTSPLMKGTFIGVAVLFFLIPLLNHWGQHLLSRVILTVGLTTLLVFAGTAYGGNNLERDYLIKLYLFANAIVPLALFSTRELGWKLLTAGVAIACFFGFQWLDVRFNILPAAETETSPLILDIMRVPVPAIFFLVLVFLFGFFQQADEENIRRALKSEQQRADELAAKEHHLQEALAQMRAAQADAESTQAQLSHAHEEAEARAASLAATRENMRRMVKRLRSNQVELEGKQAELTERQMQDAALTRLSSASRFEEGQTLESWADRLLETAMADFPQSQAALFVAESDRLRRVASYAYHYVNGSPSLIPLGEGLAGEVAKAGRPISLDGLREKDVRIRAGGLLVVQPDAVMGFPLFYSDQLQGVLELTCLHPLTPPQLELLHKEVALLGPYLHGARAQVEVKHLLAEAQSRAEQLLSQEEELRQNIEELEATQDEMKRVQARMAEQDANLNALINNTLDNIVLLDRDYRVVVANEAIRQRYFSYGLDITPGLSAFDLLNTDQAKIWKGYYDQALSGQRLNFTGKRSEHGQERYVDYWINPIFSHHHSIIGVSVFSRDVTDRVMADASLRESETALRRLNENLEQTVRERTEQVHTNYSALRTTLETTTEGICVVGYDNHIWDFNHQFAELWQLPRELAQTRDNTAIMKCIRDQVVDGERFEERLAEIIEHQPEQSSGLLELKDGRYIMVYSQRPRREHNHSSTGISRVWSYRDVTSTYLAERSLRENEARFRIFFELTSEGIFLHDRGVMKDANPALGRILGIDARDFIGKEVTDWIVPEDLELVRERVRISYELPYEVKLRHASGREVPCEIMSRGITVDGQRIKAVFVRDLSERKLAEDSLLAVARALPVATMIITYVDPRILYINENALNLCGYTAGELIGQRSKPLYYYPDDMRRMADEIRKGKGSLSNFELCMRTKAGEQAWVMCNGDRIVYQGQDALIFGFYDITDRRRNEVALRESKHQLEEAFAELRSAKTQLALSEKLALMGQLTAGIAHEINTPLGAAVSSAQSVSEMLPLMLTALSDLARILPKKQLDLIADLLGHSSDSLKPLSTREERQLRIQIQKRLVEAGLAEPEAATRLLTDLRYEGPLDELVPIFAGRHGKRVIDSARTMVQLSVNIDNINVAHGKAKRVVQALKRYTHTSSPDTIEPVNVIDNINTILILYASAIRSKGDLDTQFEGEPVVMANADTLGQVWTNLITNALQAMEGGRGTLGISVLTLADRVSVRISDTGAGIPAEVLPRIFEPFFTTKKKGEGTGMGLQIVRKIVEGYGGSIAVESQPGNTQFTIELPLATDAALVAAATS